MDEVKSTYDIDIGLESTAGVILDIDTVAIFDPVETMYGIYVKESGTALLWWLQMTSLSLDRLREV